MDNVSQSAADALRLCLSTRALTCATSTQKAIAGHRDACQNAIEEYGRAFISALEDQRRYRWLRDYTFDLPFDVQEALKSGGIPLELAIDAAMKERK